MRTERSFSVTNSFDELERLAAEVAEFCAMSEKLTLLEHRLVLVLEELLTNTINYGYDDGDTATHGIDIRLLLDGDTLDVVYSDDGRPFDPTRRPPPDMSEVVEDRPVGGLGIHLVMTIMDGVVYDRTADRNRLSMRMVLPS